MNKKVHVLGEVLSPLSQCTTPDILAANNLMTGKRIFEALSWFKIDYKSDNTFRLIYQACNKNVSSCDDQNHTHQSSSSFIQFDIFPSSL